MFGGVGEVDWCAVVSEDFAGWVVGYVDVSEVFSPSCISVSLQSFGTIHELRSG